MKNLRLKWMLPFMGLFVMNGIRALYNTYSIIERVSLRGIEYNSIFWILLAFGIVSLILAGFATSFFYDNNIRRDQ